MVAAAGPGLNERVRQFCVTDPATPCQETDGTSWRTSSTYTCLQCLSTGEECTHENRCQGCRRRGVGRRSRDSGHSELCHAPAARGWRHLDLEFAADV